MRQNQVQNLAIKANSKWMISAIFANNWIDRTLKKKILDSPTVFLQKIPCWWMDQSVMLLPRTLFRKKERMMLAVSVYQKRTVSRGDVVYRLGSYNAESIRASVTCVVQGKRPRCRSFRSLHLIRGIAPLLAILNTVVLPINPVVSNQDILSHINESCHDAYTLTSKSSNPCSNWSSHWKREMSCQKILPSAAAVGSSTTIQIHFITSNSVQHPLLDLTDVVSYTRLLPDDDVDLSSFLLLLRNPCVVHLRKQK